MKNSIILVVATLAAAWFAVAHAWDLEAAVRFAEGCCKYGGCSECPYNTLGKPGANFTHPEECAEFVSKILKHGGEDDGNIISCIPLFSYLDNPAHHWHRVDHFTDPSKVQRGDVIIYATEGPNTHTCFGVGNGIVDCHNNNHCHVSATIGYVVNGKLKSLDTRGNSQDQIPTPSVYICLCIVLCNSSWNCMRFLVTAASTHNAIIRASKYTFQKK